MPQGAFHIRSLRGGAVTGVDARSARAFARPARAFARHSHEEFGVGLVRDGAQRSWSGRGPVEAGTGQVITVNPAEAHDGAPIGGLERAWSMLYVSPELVSRVVQDLSEGRLATRELHMPVVDDGRVARLFVAARAAALDESSNFFEEELLLLFGALFGTVRSAVPTAPQRVKRVRDRIDDNLAAAHSLAELAVVAGLSRFQLLRAFARATGLTPHAYLVQRRLELARLLIRKGAPLAESAADAGFADQSHMHRAFLARHGYTPGAYAGAFRR